MATKLRRLTFYADDAIVTYLEAESARTGAPVGELLRRAVRLAQAGEAQTKIETRRAQPVLLGARQETQ